MKKFIPIKNQTCKKCGLGSEFYFCKGLCHRCDYRKRYQSNPRVHRIKLLAARRWKKKNKKYISQYQRNSGYVRNYGITLDDYNIMLRQQNYCCFLCGKKQGKDRYRLNVDHCHFTGRVRGLLCIVCNLHMQLVESKDKFLKVGKYLGFI